MNIDQVKDAIASLKDQISEASVKQWECARALQPLGAKKRGKTPEVVAQIQAEIDSLRAERQEAIALKKQLQPQLNELREKLVKLERIEELNQQQAERDKYAATQNNGYGKRPSQGRDTTWKI
jgi:chromosome segregation ATPase